MYWIIKTLAIGMDCLSSMLLLTPVVLVFQKAAGRKFLSLHTGFLLLYVCVLAGIFSVTGLPTLKYWRFELTMNLIPMADILSSPKQYFLNVLMFVPVGFLLPVLWEKYGDWKHVLGFGGFLTIFIEVAQIFTFRATDIDDLITNLLGAGLGFWMVCHMAKLFRLSLPFEKDQDRTVKGGPVVVMLAVFLIYFFIQPYWSAFFWDLVL